MVHVSRMTLENFSIKMLFTIWSWKGWSVPLHALALGFRVILKHQSLVTCYNTFQKRGIVFNCLQKICEFSFLMSSWSFETFFGPRFAKIFVIPSSLGILWRTVLWGKFNFSPSIRSAQRRSELKMKAFGCERWQLILFLLKIPWTTWKPGTEHCLYKLDTVLRVPLYCVHVRSKTW